MLSTVQVVWLITVFLRPLLKQPSFENEEDLPPVSVIVVAKNEKENLKRLIPQILEQDYRDFELVIVDNHSWDGTHEYLHEIKAAGQQIELVSLNEFVHAKPGKKFALTLGIKKAKNDIVVLTDADCIPKSDQWLREMAKPYISEATEVVLGYSPYASAPSPLNWIIRFEAFYVAWLYLSFALMGSPYMGVGRNMSYRKSTFLKNKGFASHLSLSFGDDDLLIQEIANQSNTRVVLKAESHVESIPKKGVVSWIGQKRRHLSAGERYKFKFRLLLGLMWLSKFSWYVGFILYLILGRITLPTLGVFGLPLIISWIYSIVINHKYKMFTMWYIFPVLDVLYQVLVYPLLGFVTWINPKKDGW